MNNNPVRYTDPSGHCSTEGTEGDDWFCDTKTRKSLETYTVAGIKTVSPSGGDERPKFWVDRWRKIPGQDHTSYGPAKIYTEEAEEFGVNPNTSEGAFLGMQERIRIRMDACTKCSETDKFIVAALGADYNFSVSLVQLHIPITTSLRQALIQLTGRIILMIRKAVNNFLKILI